MNTVKNAVTGIEQFHLNGTLKSLSPKVLELKNAKKTQYRLATVEILVNGSKRIITAQLWEKNVPRVTVGEIYSCTGSIMSSGRILFQLNSITQGEALTVADFGIATPAVAKVADKAQA